MTDVSSLSTEELVRIADGKAPARPDLSSMPTEELVKIIDQAGNRKPSSPWRGGKRFIDTPLVGSVEGLMALATGIPSSVVGAAGGLVKGVLGGKYGTPEGAREAQEAAERITRAGTYEPRGEAGKDLLKSINDVISISKIGGIGPTEAAAVAAMPVRQAVTQAGRGVASGAERLRREVAGPIRGADDATMTGGGAAVTEAERLRRARAASLPVPIPLSKGEATRDFAQQRFEKETMKNADIGGPLREHAMDNVDRVLKNFGTWLDETGAEAPDLISTGRAIDRPLIKRLESVKAEYKAKYAEAEKAGHMAEVIETNPLSDYLNKTFPAQTEGTVLKTAEQELLRLGGIARAPDGTLMPGRISINDLEQARKTINRIGKSSETNQLYAGELNKVLDVMTEGKGGDLYRQARSMYREYAKEFRDQGIIRRLTSNKPGTTDRKVALEDVWREIVELGSNEDMQKVMRTLEKAGPEGQQAIREIRGRTMQHLQDAATAKSPLNERSQPVPSYPQLRNAVRSLDADGKLDLIYGKKTAEQIRDIVDVLADLHTSPPGAVNTSTTASVLLGALGSAAQGRIPTATTRLIAGLKQANANRKLEKQVQETLPREQ